jgi:hypothetical protein
VLEADGVDGLCADMAAVTMNETTPGGTGGSGGFGTMAPGVNGGNGMMPTQATTGGGGGGGSTGRIHFNAMMKNVDANALVTPPAQ